MVLFKYLMLLGGAGMIAAAITLLSRDLYLLSRYKRASTNPDTPAQPVPTTHWRGALALALLAWGPILLEMGIVVVPSGTAAVRVSQTSGTEPGTLYPGAHFVTPIAESVVLFDTRDQLFTTGAGRTARQRPPNHPPKTNYSTSNRKKACHLG